MNALLQSRAQQLATEFASQAKTVEELNELMRLMMKCGLERMLDTEMNVHLGSRAVSPLGDAVVASSAALHNPTDSERLDFRENATGPVVFAIGLQKPATPKS
jgi:hypothetical protein